MLIKTEIFDKILNSELYRITINKQKPLIMRGSYKIKTYGSVVTDIDMAQFVYANQGLLVRLNQILNNIKGSNFIFTRLHCGMYNEFILPWTIDGVGSCVYNPEKAREWYTKIELLSVMDKKSLSLIKDLLFKNDITIKDLLRIKQIIRPFSEILWDQEDIRKGYKVYLGSKYDLVSLMQKGHVTVMRYLYKYNKEFVSIDFGLVDKKYIKEPSILHEYYRSDLYKIFKSYKWYIEKSYFEQYLQIMKSLEQYTGLLNRIKLISNVVRYKLLTETEINYLIQDANKYAKTLNMKYSLESEKEIEKKLNEKIDEIVVKNRTYFRNHIQDKFKKELTLYELRSEEALKPISQKDLKKRFEKGVLCPFFNIDIEDFNYLLSLAEKLKIDPQKMLNCASMVSKTYDMDISLLIRTVFRNIEKINKPKHINCLEIRDLRRYIISFQEGKNISKYNNMEEAARNGFLNIIQYHDKNNTGIDWEYAMDHAAGHGQLEVVKWLHKNRKEGCTKNAIDFASEEGNLKTIIWFHENRKEGCTTDAIDLAAKNGHFEIVKYLHKIGKKCTKKAIEWAAENGHLDIVKFLYENRKEGCTGGVKSAMNLAVRNGHLDIVKFLQQTIKK